MAATDPLEPIRQLLSEPTTLVGRPSRVREVLSGRPVVVYGCGDGLVTLSVFVLEKYGIRPEVLLDARLTKPTTIRGVPAMSPAAYEPSPDTLDSAVAVISVGKTCLHPEIFSSLRGLGFRDIVLASDLYEYHLSHAPAGFENLGFGFFAERREEILEGASLLADEKSRAVFAGVLRTHVARMPLPIPCDPLEEQYFPGDISLGKGVARFVSCGAYDGDTVRRLHDLHGRVESLACFEPDPESFARLSGYLSAHAGELADTVVAFPCGIFDDETQLRFRSGDRINSALSEAGGSVVQCVALDHVLAGFGPTFIAMDVEGAEPHALRGARNLVRRHRPDLAICVYHRPEHLWEIPLLLRSLEPGYRFHLRNYTGFPAETVLYATE